MAKAKKAKETKEERDERDARAPVARDGAYVMMLFVTLVAIAAGCVFMYLDFDEYGGKPAPAPQPVTILKLGATPAPATDGTAPKVDPAAGGAGMPMGTMP